jgi:hypothetical protein
MITYSPTTLLETAVLQSGRFALTTDAAGREVVAVGQRRLPRVILQQKAEALHGLMQEVASAGVRVFTTSDGDPWRIVEAEEEPEDCASPPAAEEYLVMGLQPLLAEGRPVRVAVRREVVRLMVLPWTIPALSLDFGGTPHYVVTGTRGVVGDWRQEPGGRRGVVVGVPEVWIGVFEQLYAIDGALALRCNVPVPWVGDDGLTGAVPSSVGVFVPRHDDAGTDPAEPGGGETWLSRLPVVLTEGDVVRPVEVPDGVEVGTVPKGPWELEGNGSADFPMGSLT